MLIDFTIENFRSILAPQTLSLLATSSTEHADNYFSLVKEKKVRLLKSIVIYGPNASGKSNIVKALQNIIHFIKFSTDLKLDQPIPYYDPFRFDLGSKQKPTCFSIEFLADGTRYKYSAAFDDKEVIEESLYFYPNKIQSKLFIRKKGKQIDFGPSLTGPKKSIEEQLLNNVLFFSKAANSKNTMIQTAYRVLNGGFLIDYDSCTTNDTIFEKLTGMLVDVGGPTASIIKRFINKIDTSITDIQIEKKDVDKSTITFHAGAPEETKTAILNMLSYKVKTTHTLESQDNRHINFYLQDESAGTVKSFSISGYITLALLGGATLVIDELTNSLHPVISRFIIGLFNNPKSNPNNAQLIFTTHDTNLLDPSLFRRDQIWFTEKDEHMETLLFSLSEFDYKEVRNNTPFEKWYLSGKFGAIPIVNDFDLSFDEVLDAKTEKRIDSKTKTENPDSL